MQSMAFKQLDLCGVTCPFVPPSFPFTSPHCGIKWYQRYSVPVWAQIQLIKGKKEAVFYYLIIWGEYVCPILETNTRLFGEQKPMQLCIYKLFSSEKYISFKP